MLKQENASTHRIFNFKSSIKQKKEARVHGSGRSKSEKTATGIHVEILKMTI